MNILNKNNGVEVMGFSKIKIIFILFGLSLIVGCSGGEPPVSADSETDSIDGAPALNSVSGRNVTFLPLSILETSSEYSGFESDNLFASEVDYPFILKNMVSVFDSKTLEPVQGIVDDFLILENDKSIDSFESFPILQNIGAIPTYLHTGIIIDVSGSVKSTIGINKVISETKSMILAMKGSADPIVANQRFSVWVFARHVSEVTSGFTSDTVILNTALDSIAEIIIQDGSNLNGAIVEAIGNYNGPGGEGGNGEYRFRDTGAENNDLIEEVSTDRIQLSSLIVITSGTDNLQVFDDEQVKTAIEAQSQVIFDTATDSEVETDAADKKSKTKNFGKPFVAVLIGRDPVVATAITDNASSIIDLKGATGDLEYAQKVVVAQANLIEQRKRESDRNVLRYATPVRQGTHAAVITTGAEDFTYSLTYDIDFQNVQTEGMPSEVYIPLTITSVEITAENNRYLQNVININDTNVFFPATRWTTTQFAVSDYTWALDGVALLADVNTGAVTIDPESIIDSATLSLTNHAISETKNIELTANTMPGIFIYDRESGQPLTGQSIDRSDIQYIDLNEADPDVEVDPLAPVVGPDEVYSVTFEDYNTPLESYAYGLSLLGWLSFDDAAPGTPFDYKLIGNRIQIQKSAIDGLDAPIIISIDNETLGTNASFTITL